MNYKPIKNTAAGMMIGALLSLSVVVPTASAQTPSLATLQTQIQSLLAQIALLQQRLAQQAGVGSSVCPYTWTRNLTIGASGADVLRLQQFLNSDSATRVATVGVGSPGMETQYFGPLTAAAVSKFQLKYRSEVLAPYGLVNPTGFFGPSTRAKMNILCVVVPATPPADTTGDVGDSDTDSDTDTDADRLRGGEASLERFKVSSGDDTNLNEGQRNARIMDVEFKVENGDVRLDRIDVAFEHQLGTEDDPWDTFDSVSLYLNGDRIAQKDTDSERAWREDEPFTGAHSVRFTGLNQIVREGDTAELTVAVTLANSIRGADSGLSWNVFIPDRGIRARDGENIDQYTGDETDTVNIDINEEGADDELAVRSSTKDPEATTLQLKRTTRSDWMTVFAFDLDTDDSENDIEIRELPVSLTVSAGTVGAYLNDVRLKIDGDTFEDVTITDGATNMMIFEFDRNEFVIDAGDRVTVEVQVRFNALAAANEGVMIEGSASSTNIEAEGADDLTATQLSGTATGDQHSLRTVGSTFATGNSSAERIVNATNDVTDDEGSFKITFSVTAFESDIYVNRSAANGTALGTAGANYLIEDSVGDPVSTGSFSASLSSSASVVGGRYRVPEGQTKSFTLSVVFDPDTSGFYRLQLYSLNFATSNDDPTIQQRALPENRYETDPLSI